MFCESCGTKLPEDALFCEKCGAKQNVEPMAPAPQPEPVVVAPQEPNAFAKAFGKIPAFFKSPANAAKQAADNKEYGPLGILTGVFALSTFMYLLFYGLAAVVRYNAQFFKYGGGFLYGASIRFGMMLLGAILVTILAASIYILPTTLVRIIFKKDASFGKALGDAFAEFPIYALPLAAGLLLAGFAAFISTAVSFIILALFGICFIVVLMASVYEKAGGIADKFVKLLIIVGIVAGMLIIGHYLFAEVKTWLVNYNAGQQIYEGISGLKEYLN